MPARTARSRRAVLALAFATPLLLLPACSAGQESQTSEETPDVAGVQGATGPLVLDDVFLQSTTAIPAGASVPLRGTFTNNGGTDERLVSVSTPAAPSVQMFTATGAPSPQGLDIPAGGQVDAVTGTVRLRLVDVTSPIPITQLVPVTFVFGDSRQLTLRLPVATTRQGDTPSSSSPRTSEASAG